MASCERLCAIAYYTTEFDFTKGFARWHVCWHIDQMAIGARSKQFTTRVIDGKDCVRNQWELEFVKDDRDENNMAICLRAIQRHPAVPMPAIIRTSMFISGSPTFSKVDYTVFSSYSPDFVCPLPKSEQQRETTMKRQRCACGGNSTVRTDTELHCSFSFPIEAAAKHAYFSKVISTSFIRATIVYHKVLADGHPDPRLSERDMMTVKVKVADDDGPEDSAHIVETCIYDPLLLDCLNQRRRTVGALNELLLPFMRTERDRGRKRETNPDGQSPAGWPVRPWYEAVLISCFTADRHRNAQWKATMETHCESLPHLRAICLVQMGHETEPCCVSSEAHGSPKSAQSTHLLAHMKGLQSRNAKGKRRRTSSDKTNESDLLELQAELSRMKNLIRPVEAIEVGSKAPLCACACAIL